MIAPAIKATSPDPSRHALLWVQYTFLHPRRRSILATALPLWTEGNGKPFHPKTEAPTTFYASILPPTLSLRGGLCPPRQSPVGWLLYPSKTYVIASHEVAWQSVSPIHVSSTKSLQKEYGLPRLFEPRNDRGFWLHKKWLAFLPIICNS